MTDIAMQRELGNRQNFTTRIEDGAIHLVVFILKNAEIDGFIHAIAHILRGITILNAAKHHESLADAPDFPSVHLDA